MVPDVNPTKKNPHGPWHASNLDLLGTSSNLRGKLPPSLNLRIVTYIYNLRIHPEMDHVDKKLFRHIPPQKKNEKTLPRNLADSLDET